MKKIKILLLICALFTSFSAFAGIRVYDPNTGDDMKLDALVDSGDIEVKADKPVSKMSENEKAKLAKQELMRRMRAVPETHKNIEDQRNIRVGTVIGFVDYESLDKSLAKIINDIDEFKKVRSVFYLKTTGGGISALASIAVKVGSEIKPKIKFDPNNRNARRLHVDSYPTLIYVDPDKNMARFSFSSGGFMALKTRVGEVELIMQERAKNQQK